jgi:hypothetical protein
MKYNFQKIIRSRARPAPPPAITTTTLAMTDVHCIVSCTVLSFFRIEAAV